MSRAHGHLSRAAILAGELGVAEARERYEFLAWWAWLANTSTFDTARDKFLGEIRRVEFAVRVLGLAIAYNIEFDIHAVRDHLAKRRQVRSWSAVELQAALLCALSTDSPESVQEFLSSNRHDLEQCFPDASICDLEIRAAIQAGKTETARELLRSYGARLSERDRIRLAARLQDTGSAEISA